MPSRTRPRLGQTGTRPGGLCLGVCQEGQKRGSTLTSAWKTRGSNPQRQLETHCDLPLPRHLPQHPRSPPAPAGSLRPQTCVSPLTGTPLTAHPGPTAFSALAASSRSRSQPRTCRCRAHAVTGPGPPAPTHKSTSETSGQNLLEEADALPPSSLSGSCQGPQPPRSNKLQTEGDGDRKG